MNRRTLFSDIAGSEGISRRDILTTAAKGAAIAAVAAALPGCGGGGTGSTGPTPSSVDEAAFQFLLELEYLEAEFYTYATSGQTIAQQGIVVTGIGTPGATTGGVQTIFTDPRVKELADETASDDREHVKVLQGALGSASVAKPAINLAALGTFATQSEFLAIARVLKDVVASAYAGLVPSLTSTPLMDGVRIGIAEGYHASAIRLVVIQNGISSQAVDSLDLAPPPAGTKYFDVVGDGLVVSRTPSQVLKVLYAGGTKGGGFYPQGINLSATSASTIGL